MQTRRLRHPAVAGRFYESDPARCAACAEGLCRPFADTEAIGVLHGMVVPHAGWNCSGRVAGAALATLSRHTRARTFLITGSVHTVSLDHPALDAADAWSTPLGDVPVDVELREALEALPGFAIVGAAHEREHSLEVQLPLMLAAMGEGLSIVPCLIPPHPGAAEWGAALAPAAGRPAPVAIVASSDLTHYGPSYGFMPHGAGEGGRRWAREVNDRALLDLLVRMDAETIVRHARERRNACGAGALAATVAACREMGATGGRVLDHTDSARELAAYGEADRENSVGYAAVAFG